MFRNSIHSREQKISIQKSKEKKKLVYTSQRTHNVNGLVIVHALIHNSVVPLNLSLPTVQQTVFITKPIYSTALTSGIHIYMPLA